MLKALLFKLLYRVKFPPCGNGKCKILLVKRWRWSPGIAPTPKNSKARWHLIEDR